MQDQLDIPVMIDRLINSGIKINEIAEVTGISKSKLEYIRKEHREWPVEWDRAIRLLGLYFLTNKPLPIYGDHN